MFCYQLIIVYQNHFFLGKYNMASIEASPLRASRDSVPRFASHTKYQDLSAEELLAILSEQNQYIKELKHRLEFLETHYHHQKLYINELEKSNAFQASEITKHSSHIDDLLVQLKGLERENTELLHTY
jgi:uncharacterized coiled-coil protein SlyX